MPVYGLDELQIDCVASGGQPHFEVVNGFTGGSRVGPLVEVRTVVEGLPHARREVVAAPLTIGRGLPGVDADVTVPDLDQFRSVSRLALLLEPDLVVGVLRCQVRSISGAIYRPRVGEPRTQRVNDVVDLMPGDAIQLTHDDSFTVLYLLDPDETSEVPVM